MCTSVFPRSVICLSKEMMPKEGCGPPNLQLFVQKPKSQLKACDWHPKLEMSYRPKLVAYAIQL